MVITRAASGAARPLAHRLRRSSCKLTNNLDQLTHRFGCTSLHSTCVTSSLGHARPLLGRSSQQRRIGEYGKRHRAYDDLLQHKGVGSLCMSDGVVYVVPASRSEFGFPFGVHSKLNDRALEDYLETTCGYEKEEIPEIRIVTSLPKADEGSCPFMLQYILDSLFRSLDTDGSGTISMEEFRVFCQKFGFFNDDVKSMKKAFRAADHQTLRAFGGGELDASEFKDLMFEIGLVEARVGEEAAVGGAYLIDDHIVDVVLKNWFACYDTDGDGSIDFKEYCRLIADYQLPYAVSREGFNKLDVNGDGVIDRDEFKTLMMESKILATGEAISRKEDEEGLRKTWRALEASQKFLPPSRVLQSAQALPPKGEGAVRFVCISDTHGNHRDLTAKIPPGDVLLHAGDFTMAGELREIVDFASWLKDLPFERKIIIAGNHDLTLDVDYPLNEYPYIIDAAKKALADHAGDSVTYLHDDTAIFRGLRIYGTPWQPAFGSWAFNVPRGEPLAQKWRQIPEGIDVLLVHGPAMGRGDMTDKKHVGCADLLHEIQNRVRPTFCVAGHIHQPCVDFDGVTHYVNASSCDEEYECVHAPQVFDIPQR